MSTRLEIKSGVNAEKVGPLVMVLYSGSLKEDYRGETLDVTMRMKVRIPTMPFFPLKNRYGNDCIDHTGGTGPVFLLSLHTSFFPLTLSLLPDSN